MGDQSTPQNTLREELEGQFDALETAQAAGGDAPAQAAAVEGETAAAAAQRARDEAGRFVKVDGDAPPKAAPAAQQQPPAADQAQAQAAAQAALQRPTSWKKEYLPIWDKLATGQPLTAEEARKLAEYSQQRENEYKTGVSTYKMEAVQAREMQEAIAPFVSRLQQSNIPVGQWIRSVGEANLILHEGTPQQKLQLVAELCQRYNVPIGALVQQPGQQAQPNPLAHVQSAIAADVQALRQQLANLQNWQATQESSTLQSMVHSMAADKQRYPHFEAVRETMAQLLERGLAPDLPTAYDQSLWMVDEVREALISERAQAVARPQAVAKAKAAAVSPRSSTPSGQVARAAAKDRRALLADAFDEVEGGRV